MVATVKAVSTVSVKMWPVTGRASEIAAASTNSERGFGTGVRVVILPHCFGKRL